MRLSITLLNDDLNRNKSNIQLFLTFGGCLLTIEENV
jgi:hypothetical protein